MNMNDAENLLPPELAGSGMHPVLAYRIPAAQHPAFEELCWVVEERALLIDVADVGQYTLMRTRTEAPCAAGFLPSDGVLAAALEPETLTLAAGFLFTEGIIDGMDDLASMAVCPDSSDVVRVRLVDPACAQPFRRSGLVASSCGICGDTDMQAARARLPKVADALRLEAAGFPRLLAAMESRQAVFNTTGGTHAAALFDRDATLIACAEDLGRHNALDKAIGQCLLRRRPTVGCGAILSGRVSLELIVKAGRAGLEIVAAVSAPSSLAVATAERLGITLCGFVRNGRLTVFTHPWRLQ